MASLEVKFHGIDVQFSETYDSAPPLPRPLRSKHHLKYITGEGLLAESLSVAPLTQQEEARVVDMGLGDVRSMDDDPPVVKYTKRLMIYYRKASEFALVHEELAGWYESQTSMVSSINTATSFIVSGLVVVNIEVPGMHVILACLVVVVGMMKSWVIYVKFDTLEAGHSTAARNFAFIAEKIRDLLALMADLEPEEVAEEFGGSKEEANAQSSCVRDILAKYKEAKYRAKALKDGIGNIKNLDGKKHGSGAEDIEAGPIGTATAPQTVLRLRTLYRRAVQYRLAHSLFETKFRHLRIGLAFSHLSLTTLTSAFMFLQIGGGAVTVLSVALSALNTVIQATGFAQREIDHTSGRIAWASVQRSFATTLMLQNAKEVRSRFDEYSTQYTNTAQSIVPVKGLHFFRDPKDKSKPMFDLITPSLADSAQKRAGGFGGKFFKRFMQRAQRVHDTAAEAKKRAVDDLAAKGGQGAAAVTAVGTNETVAAGKSAQGAAALRHGQASGMAAGLQMTQMQGLAGAGAGASSSGFAAADVTGQLSADGQGIIQGRNIPPGGAPSFVRGSGGAFDLGTNTLHGMPGEQLSMQGASALGQQGHAVGMTGGLGTSELQSTGMLAFTSGLGRVNAAGMAGGLDTPELQGTGTLSSASILGGVNHASGQGMQSLSTLSGIRAEGTDVLGERGGDAGGGGAGGAGDAAEMENRR